MSLYRRLQSRLIFLTCTVTWIKFNLLNMHKHQNRRLTSLGNLIFKQFCIIIPRHTKGAAVLCYTLRIFWVSVRSSAFRFRTLTWAVFDDFLQTLHGHWYRGGVVWDCKWAKFVYKQHSYGPLLMKKCRFQTLTWVDFDRPFLQTLHGHWYQERVVWDCKWAKFVYELWPLIDVTMCFSSISSEQMDEIW